MPTTTAWLPNSYAICAMSAGFSSAGELMEILSAPPLRTRRASSTVRMPPATEHARDTLDPAAVHRAPVAAGGDVVEHEFVGIRGAVAASQIDDIAHHLVVAELDALDDAPILHVEAGNDPPAQHASASASENF